MKKKLLKLWEQILKEKAIFSGEKEWEADQQNTENYLNLNF